MHETTTSNSGLSTDGPLVKESSHVVREGTTSTQNQPTLNANLDPKPRYPRPPKFDDPYKEREYLKGRMAIAFRIFAKLGFEEGVVGHITLRDPVTKDCFWINPFGTAFSLITSSSLILVDSQGKVIAGGENKLLNLGAYMIHHAIHVARPEVMCVAHSHSQYGRAFCTLGRELDMLTQDFCTFYNDHVIYDDFQGVVKDEQEGKDIATCLAGKKAVLMQNHGPLAVGETVEEAVFWFTSLDKCCQTQLVAEAAAASRSQRPSVVSPAAAAYSHSVLGGPKAGYFAAKPMFDTAENELKGAHLL